MRGMRTRKDMKFLHVINSILLETETCVGELIQIIIKLIPFNFQRYKLIFLKKKKKTNELNLL